MLDQVEMGPSECRFTVAVGDLIDVNLGSEGQWDSWKGPATMYANRRYAFRVVCKIQGATGSVSLAVKIPQSPGGSWLKIDATNSETCEISGCHDLSLSTANGCGPATKYFCLNDENEKNGE
jgi:hypothetical protein